MPVKAPVYRAPPPQVFSWTGFYLGANGGYAWNRLGASETPIDPLSALQISLASTSFNTAGGVGGLQAGYNWQFNEKWVAGVEADFDAANIAGNGSTPVVIVANPATFGASQNVDWFGTFRARLGYLPVNNVLVFATGGLAFGKVDQSANVTIAPGFAFGPAGFGFAYGCSNPASFTGPACFSGSQSRVAAGWTVGGGAEVAPARNWTLKVEYLYVNLGSNNYNIFSAYTQPATISSFLNTSFGNAAFSLVRVGANWRF